MERRIVFVGGEIAVDLPEVINLSFRSDDSLLDGDVIVFTIDLKSYHADDWFQGLRRLTDDCSFRLAKDVQHWRSELSSALTDGKTVIFFVTQIHQVSIATGRKEYSGTGRNARVTNIVTTLEPYNVIPIPVGTVVRKSGAHIKPTGDLGILATYWHEFGPYTTYDAYLDDFKGTTLLSTQTGGKTVGGILRHPTWKSALILLPTPDLSTPSTNGPKACNRSKEVATFKVHRLGQEQRRIGKRLRPLLRDSSSRLSLPWTRQQEMLRKELLRRLGWKRIASAYNVKKKCRPKLTKISLLSGPFS